MKKTCYIQSFYTYQIIGEGKSQKIKYNYFLQYIIEGKITNVCISYHYCDGYTAYTEYMYKQVCEHYEKNIGDDYHLEINHYNIK